MGPVDDATAETVVRLVVELLTVVVSYVLGRWLKNR
jgi:hypothetical protein